LKHIIDNLLPEVVAVKDKQIVGWCDIIPGFRAGYTHVGHLGMGVRREYRRQGIGQRLLSECLVLAKNYGLERVELEVFSDNEAAISLYEKFNFEVEGEKKYARKFEGKYQDINLMALLL